MEAVSAARFRKRKVAGSIPPTIGDFHTVGPCKKAGVACLATDEKKKRFTFYDFAHDLRSTDQLKLAGGMISLPRLLAWPCEPDYDHFTQLLCTFLRQEKESAGMSIEYAGSV